MMNIQNHILYRYPQSLKSSCRFGNGDSLEALLKQHIDQRFEAEPILRQYHQLSENQPETLQRYSKTTQPPFEFTAERERLHQSIIRQYLGPFLTPPASGLGPKTVHIVTGLPGSGKSVKVVAPLAQQNPTFFKLDMDELSNALPEYHVPVSMSDYGFNQQNGLGARAVHREAQYLALKVFNHLITSGQSLIMSYVGEKVQTELNLIRMLKTKGYNVFLHHVQASPKTAIDRVIQRFKDTGRYVSPFNIAKLGNQSTEAFHELIRLSTTENLLTGHSLYQNNAS